MAEQVATGEPKSVLEEWLNGIPKRVCFTERMKVYIPTCYDRCPGEVKKLEDRLNELLGGSTVYKNAEGCWLEKAGKPIECEPVEVIEIGHNCANKEDLKEVTRAILDYATTTKQKSISILNGHFYIGKTLKMVKHFEKEFSKV